MIGGSNIVKGARNDIYADTATDVTDLEQFAEDWELTQGSTCLVIDTFDVYVLKSDGTWKKK